MVLRGEPVGEQGVAGRRRAFGPGGGPGAWSQAPGPPSLCRASRGGSVERGEEAARGPRAAYIGSSRGRTGRGEP